MASPNQINISFTEEESAAIDRVSQATGVPRVELARRCVQALIAYCADGRRPTFPLSISSPGYIVENGRVRDATVIITGTELGMDPKAPAKSAAAKPQRPAPRKMERPQAS